VNRQEWLQDVRREAEQRFDTVFAPTYDEQDPPIDATHRRFVAELISGCRSDGTILDAACGTGKYFAMVRDGGRRVVGCDQSAGMLAQAAAKFPDVETNKVGLQELAYNGEFDAAMCVDAMENVFPEDWPAVLANLRRALRPGGCLYFTVEMTDPDWLIESFAIATERRLPVVPNEDTNRGGEAYHHYPPLDQVRGWLDAAGLDVIEEMHSDGDHPSYSYQHFLTRNGDRPPG
jgi:ubiquinone/menaquinone biosynthesis C-methylase UbiE